MKEHRKFKVSKGRHYFWDFEIGCWCYYQPVPEGQEGCAGQRKKVIHDVDPADYERLQDLVEFADDLLGAV